MQASGDKEDTPDHASESSLTGKPSQKFVYPIRSLLGPLQPYGDMDIFEEMLSPPIHSSQIPLSENADGSYFTQVPGKSTKPLQDGVASPMPEDAFLFRHFPAEEGSRAFDPRPRKSEESGPARHGKDRDPEEHAPYQTETPGPDADNGDTIVVSEIDVQAPQPVHSSPGMAGALEEIVDDATPPFRGQADDVTPPYRTHAKPTPSRGSGNDADDENGSRTGSARATSSLGSSEREFASTGLVHLPPIGRLETAKRTREWRGRVIPSSQEPSTAPSSNQSHSHNRQSHPNSQASSSLVSSSIPPRIDEEPGEDEEKSKQGTGNASFSVMTSSSHDGGPVVTMRFEHKEDENGHHVLVGREGKLTKCEDEPIRIPGAVQGFGVLMVVHDDSNSGQMKVRQVSENSKVILGLAPRFLFSLDCFSNTLPSSQADLLWDNIQFLNDPDLDEDDDEGDNTQIFLLSGWGEPDTALEETEDPQKRRQWTCWVAAHRIRSVNTGEAETSASGAARPGRKLIILEFELENDVFNPLYPLPGTPNIPRSDDSSPFQAGSATASGSRSGSSADQTARGTKSTNSPSPGVTESTTPSEATPRADGTTTTQAQSEGSGSAEESVTTSAALTTMAPTGDVVPSSEEEWTPSNEAILKSTTSRSRPLKTLERMRRFSRASTAMERSVGSAASSIGTRLSHGPVGTMDVFTVLQEVNEQMGKALDLLELLDIVVGVIKDLTQFHRVMCYQFDELWNGQVVSELVDWSQSRDLFMGLHFPAGDIPAQWVLRSPSWRHFLLTTVDRVRLLYDRSQSTARLVVKDRTDLEPPVDMTHCYLRAMSPIHIKYLGNMGVRASMSISIVAFNKLWGMLTCHSYGNQGMRVSFPVRQMLRLLSDSISRNVERLSYAQRLRTRKLISTVPTDQHPTGYIVSNSEDLLTLFDADCGVLVIGEGAKILGPNENGQDILLLAEYLRVKQFTLLQVSRSVMQDYPDLQLPSGLDVIAGLLYVPLSMTGKDFIALLRKGQAKDVNWAERLTGKCRAWLDEQLDTAAVLALVYGKFIEVWRQKESAMQMNQMTTLLLSNASHEVRTPLHQIINYLELALDGTRLDEETRENLTRSHAASKALLFTINDLLDLTRLEAGKETSFSEPFDLHIALNDAVNVYRVEASRRQIDFVINLGNAPKFVVGDVRKIKTVVANLTSNAVKYTQQGSVSVTAHTFEEPDGLRALGNVAVEIIVSDTGCGIQPEKLESIFREFEQVDNNRTDISSRPGLGLGLAVVARVVEQLGGQLRVDSKIGEGSRFSCLLPFPIASTLEPTAKRSASTDGTGGSGASNTSEIDSLVEALSSSHMVPSKLTGRVPARRPKAKKPRAPSGGKFAVEDSAYPVRGIKVDEFDIDLGPSGDDVINARVLKKRLINDGHEVVTVVDGQQAVDLVANDRNFDCILMDIQMPILDGFGATEGIRKIERTAPLDGLPRRSTALTGRIPIFAVSASLTKDQRPYMINIGMDGWILKPIDFKRMTLMLSGIHSLAARYEQEMKNNDVLYPKIVEITKIVSDGGPPAFSSTVERFKTQPAPDAPGPGQTRYDDMLHELMVSVWEECKKEGVDAKDDKLGSILTAKLEGHQKQLLTRQEWLKSEIKKEKEEQEKKITSDDIHEGFSAGVRTGALSCNETC
ncbi:hypothetical protein M408DRAFT_15706 [Serendipita vermifera MAFF 305830]|uniref:Histidine kinase n=1 Tax=Serendipita vermifera MAFF 305830 TaxID=933852 RepID=A0A0C2XME5_SERVB|nr:hypothetical protein M408DRAFT_15706 [Serendipita vermifera MAFF 305830]